MADWGGGMSASCTAGQVIRQHGQSTTTMRRDIFSSCQSAATFEIVEHFRSRD